MKKIIFLLMSLLLVSGVSGFSTIDVRSPVVVPVKNVDSIHWMPLPVERCIIHRPYSLLADGRWKLIEGVSYTRYDGTLGCYVPQRHRGVVRAPVVPSGGSSLIVGPVEVHVDDQPLHGGVCEA